MSEPEVPSSREVEDLLQPYRKLVTRLRRSEALTHGDIDLALRQVTELAAQILRVERASVWRLTDCGGRIECLDMFRQKDGDGVHDRIAPLVRDDAKRYFAALEEERCIVAHDAREDVRTAVLDGYLEANGIGAILDAPIFLHGELVGVVCHEHVGGPRLWRMWEELVAGTMADFVAQVIEAGELLRTKAEVARYRAHLEEETALRNVFEAAPVPLVLARADGTIELFNPRALEVIGVPEGFVPGSVHGGRFYARSEDRETLLAELRTKGFVDGRELLMKSWSGDEHWCLASFRLIAYRGQPHVIMGFSEITAQKEVEARLREAALRDPLTGIHNRRHFFDTAANELARARRYARPLTLAMIDADHFKAHNDRHGHVVGDELLVALAKIVTGELRQSDLLARYGGEEFVALFPESDLDAGFTVTERIRGRLAESPIVTTAGPVTLTCSGGVVLWDREESLAQLIDRADRALYAAKSAGRNRVERG